MTEKTEKVGYKDLSPLCQIAVGYSILNFVIAVMVCLIFAVAIILG